MKTYRSIRLALTCASLLLGAASAFTVCAQVTAAQPLDPLSLGWPRTFEASGYEFAVYQPQVDKWPGNRIEGRFVLATRPAGTSNETYGVAFFAARTEIDKVNRLVTLEDWEITKTDFPTDKSRQQFFRGLVQTELPKAAKTIPLDHLEAVFAIAGDIQKAKEVQVANTPPRIIYTTTPSLLVLVDGAPMYAWLVGSYERVINTRSLLLQNTNVFYQSYYLYAASNWYAAPSLEGPWTTALNPPPDISTALTAALATKEVDPMYPKVPLAAPPTVYVSTTPAELIQTTGTANLLPVGNTDLLYVPNSGNALFYDLDDANYYILISGRWFKALSFYGPWTFVPPGSLPAGFQKIPEDNPKANVLCSVPGTPQSREAVIANSIPQTASIEKDKAKLTVEYGGAPGFVPIAGTSLQYATNTHTAVIRVKANAYYACEGGVWFVSPSPEGPWAVAAAVPSAIYSIPPTCPIHYVTYVYVYGSTTQYVYVGYTPGYMGTVVAPGGVVVYGTGYYYPPVVVGTSCVYYPPTYGYGARLALGAAVGFAFGYAAGCDTGCWCEPHWGCYGWAYPCGYSYTHINCNSANFYTSWGTAVHASGAYGYNPYTGTHWGAQSASGYNPYTGTSAYGQRGAAYNPYSGNYAAGRSGTAYNPYSGAQAAGRQGVEGNAYTGNYAAGKQGAGYNPSTGMYGAGSKATVGNAYTGNSASASRGVMGNANTGNKVAWNNGNMYADHNGNIYSSNGSGGAQKWNSSANSWSSASKPASSSWGNQSWGQSMGSDRFSNFSSSGGGGWGGSHSGGWGGSGGFGGGGFGGGGGGWGGFHGGGFRR